MILQKLKADAEAYLGEPVTEAVITVPAYFKRCPAPGYQRCRAHCGPECNAHYQTNLLRAALAYGLDNGKTQKVMVYDLGGGTFDVSLIQIGDGIVQCWPPAVITIWAAMTLMLVWLTGWCGTLPLKTR